MLAPATDPTASDETAAAKADEASDQKSQPKASDNEAKVKPKAASKGQKRQAK